MLYALCAALSLALLMKNGLPCRQKTGRLPVVKVFTGNTNLP